MPALFFPSVIACEGIGVPRFDLRFQILDSPTLSPLGMRNRVFAGAKTAGLLGSELTPQAIRMLIMAIRSDCFPADTG